MRSDERKASGSDDNSVELEDEQSLCYEGEFTPLQWELQSKSWYWADTSRETLALAMQKRPTGTFAVRDASTPGDYTLTVRVDNANKLIRIYVVNDKVGFTPETMDFSSVVDLVEYYRNCSLEEHNPALKTSLKFPLSRDDRNESPMPAASDNIGIAVPDHISKKLTVTKHRCSKKMGEEQQAIRFVLHHFLESIIAEMLRAERRHKQIQSQVETLEQEYKNHKKAMHGYENIQNLLKSGQKLLQESLDAVDSDNTRQTVATNKILQNKRLKNVKEMKARLRVSLEGIERVKNGLQIEDAVMVKRAKIIKDRCERYTNELQPHGINREFIDKKTRYIRLAMEKESEKLLQNLLKVNLVTSPFDWLTRNSDKKYSNDLVQKSLSLLKKRGVTNTNGVFLIRPSSSRLGCFAMVISMNEVIYNCLIEYQPPKSEGEVCGYAFLNTNLFYTTLSDFIRYYSLVTLREHNENLDTVLRIPVLKYLSSVLNRQQMVDQSIDEEEALLISGLKLDQADCYTLDDENDQEFSLN